MKTVVIYHRADFDGLFCREIARKFIPDAELIGWDFGDKPIAVPDGDAPIYVLDLPVDRVFGFHYKQREGSGATEIHFQKDADPKFLTSALPFGFMERVIWIDHHASSIKSHSPNIPGYRIDGVAACRLAWQWFNPPMDERGMPMKYHHTKEAFVDRIVSEPFAVQLAGEYDVWDKRNPNAELFQHGLRSEEIKWPLLLNDDKRYVGQLLKQGITIDFVRTNEYREVIQSQGFDVHFEGFNFLACNSHELDIRSHLFAAGIKPHHDGLLGFTYTGKDWRVSLYGVPHEPEVDLSQIAIKYGGGGHKQACGFRTAKLPFIS